MRDRIAVMRGGSITAMLPGKSDAHDVMAAALGQEPGGLLQTDGSVVNTSGGAWC